MASQDRKFLKNRNWHQTHSRGGAFAVGLGTGLIFCLLPIFAQQTTSGNSVSLPLTDVVVLANEGSPFQVNLEKAGYEPGDDIDVPLSLFRALNEAQSLATAERSDIRKAPSGSLDEFFQRSAIITRESITRLLKNATNHTLVQTNAVFTLIPNASPWRERPDPLDHVVPRYAVENTNLFAALSVLCKSVPFTLQISSPVHVTRGHTPDLGYDYPHWPLADMPVVTFSATNASVRSILSALVNPRKKAYWIASPPFAPSVKDIKANLPVVDVEIYHSLESRSVSLSWKWKSKEEK